MPEIQVGRPARGLWAQVDDSDYDLVSQYTWALHRDSDRVYARRQWRDENARQRHQFLHTLITGWPYVDHEDHDGLNCQRYNMRESDPQTNAMNARRLRSGTSRFKGVSWHCATGKWQAQIRLGGTRSLGLFEVESDAARAYDAAAIELFGEFACTNEMLGRYDLEVVS